MPSAIEVVRASLDALPVFPLPAVTLFPGELLPLHIFEPRYRAMTEHVLQSGRALAVAQLLPGWEGDYDGRPPIARICGVGVVVQHHRLDDGRYNLLLRGVARVAVEEELPPAHPFREARARLLDDVYPPDPQALGAPEAELKTMLLALGAARPGRGMQELLEAVAGAPDAGAEADLVCAALLGQGDRRQAALEALDVVRRLELARAAVADVLAEASPAGDSGLLN